jgi:hypothetical protein
MTSIDPTLLSALPLMLQEQTGRKSLMHIINDVHIINDAVPGWSTFVDDYLKSF